MTVNVWLLCFLRFLLAVLTRVLYLCFIVKKFHAVLFYTFIFHRPVDINKKLIIKKYCTATILHAGSVQVAFDLHEVNTVLLEIEFY